MKNKYIIVLFSVLLLICSGCSESNKKTSTEQEYHRFSSNGCILLDKETNIEYYDTGYAVSVLVDKDGKPLQHKEK